MGGVETPSDLSSELKRTIGLRTVISTSAGLTFASSTFLIVVTVGVAVGGRGAWLPILIAGILCILAASAFAELSGLYPNAAGIRVYLQRAFSEQVALSASLTYMSIVLLVVGAEAYVLSFVLHDAMPAIPPPIWIFIMLSIATVANFRGLKVSGALQDLITYSVVISIILFSVFALKSVHLHFSTLLMPGNMSGVVTAVGFAIFLFVGFEWVTPLAEEVREIKTIAIGMYVAVIMLTLVYALVATSMFATTPNHSMLGSMSNRNPTPHITFAMHVFGLPGKILMIITSIAMSLTTFNAGLISVSRFLYASARDHVLPNKLAHISVKYATPDTAVLVVYLFSIMVSFLVYYTHTFLLMVNMAAATEAFIYAFAAAAVVKLRRTEPDRTRTFKIPGGTEVSAVISILFVVIGILVFIQPGWQTEGAGILLVCVSVCWWIYIKRVAIPRREQIKAMRSSRSTRRIRTEEGS